MIQVSAERIQAVFEHLLQPQKFQPWLSRHAAADQFSAAVNQMNGNINARQTPIPSRSTVADQVNGAGGLHGHKSVKYFPCGVGILNFLDEPPIDTLIEKKFADLFFVDNAMPHMGLSMPHGTF
jgi:hypothetical protein